MAYLAHGSRLEPIITGKSGQLLEAASHINPQLRAERNECIFAFSTFTHLRAPSVDWVILRQLIQSGDPSETGQLPSLLVPDCVTVAERASTDSSQNFTDPCCNILQAVACTQ